MKGLGGRIVYEIYYGEGQCMGNQIVNMAPNIAYVMGFGRKSTLPAPGI